MSSLGFLALLGIVLGGVLALLVVFIAGAWVVAKLGDVVSGLPRVRASLLGRGLDARLADRVIEELEKENGGMGCGLLIGGLALAALGYGLYTLAGMYAPETDELLLYPAPGLLGLLVAGVLVVRARRIDADASATHRALITRASEVSALVPTTKQLNLDISTTGDALARTRVTQWTPVPHVMLVYRDGSYFAVRAFDDRDHHSTSLIEALRTALPNVPVEPFRPTFAAASEPPAA